MSLDKEVLWMQRALDLANMGSGFVAPNPLVGCVIVKNDNIIGEGYHQKYGEAHAEVNAIHSLVNPSDIVGSTIYVNLEPCSHHGKTPPCADLLIKSRVKRVVICNIDPNPIVAGEGITALKKAGIEVSVGILAEKGEEINRKFFHFQREKKPYITLKFACSQDNFVAKTDGTPIAFSNSESQQLVHKMRAENQGILIGVQTAIADNPTLNVRHWQGNSPLRIVIDPSNRLPKESKLVQDHEPLIVFTKHHSETVGDKKWIAVRDKNPTEVLDCILTYCYKNNIQSIMVEGGTHTANQFHAAGLIHEIWKIEKSLKLGDGLQAPTFPGVLFEKKFMIGQDNIWLKALLPKLS
jgi:diaminohydroxyphosphoribosylaminopyrimidine deaminase/5-amino-6-(5-phosphoribosylamino)uracil reductase